MVEIRALRLEKCAHQNVKEVLNAILAIMMSVYLRGLVRGPWREHEIGQGTEVQIGLSGSTESQKEIG
jgi:hypothetical protein